MVMTSPVICYVYQTYVDFNACIISDIKYMYMLTSLQAGQINFVFSSKLFQRREKFLKTENERVHWNQLSYRYMSEESPDEDGLTIFKLRSPSWRSEG